MRLLPHIRGTVLRLAAVLTATIFIGKASGAREFISFVDVHAEAGLDFRNVCGDPKKDYLIESVGSGAAFFDYDNDGYMDIYLVNGSRFRFSNGALTSTSNEPRPTSRLYRNLGDGRFVDVTDQAGVGNTGWGMGVAAADYDNDGYQDLYVTNYGANVLYHNNGDGTFADVAVKAGVQAGGWSTGCAWGDYDNDGYLDLYVAGYVDFAPEDTPPKGANIFCRYRGIPVQCGPRGLKGAPDVLYHNNGDGTFTDVTIEAGVLDDKGYYGFAVVWGDYDNDGFLDIFVANDSTPNFLYRNNGDGTFTNVATLAGCAYSEDGREQACMGADLGDYDNDGFLDIFLTNFSDDYNTLYRNDGSGFFSDITHQAGLGTVSLQNLGWGTKFFDYDNDGYRDLFVANGHIYPEVDWYKLDTGFAQINQLFRNKGNGSFEDMTNRCGDGLRILKSSRGAAFGDYDNDGDIDILINNLDDEPTLLRNDGGNMNNWLIIKAVGSRSNRDGIGARIKIKANGLTQMDEVRSGGSYLSTNDVRVHFGLGKAAEVEILEIRWPSGLAESFKNIKANQLLVVKEKP